MHHSTVHGGLLLPHPADPWAAEIPCSSFVNFQSPSWNILVLEMGELPLNFDHVRPSSPPPAFPHPLPAGNCCLGWAEPRCTEPAAGRDAHCRSCSRNTRFVSKPNPTAFIQVRVSPPVCRQMAAVSCTSTEWWWSSSKRTVWKSLTKAKKKQRWQTGSTDRLQQWSLKKLQGARQAGHVRLQECNRRAAAHLCTPLCVVQCSTSRLLPASISLAPGAAPSSLHFVAASGRCCSSSCSPSTPTFLGSSQGQC